MSNCIRVVNAVRKTVYAPESRLVLRDCFASPHEVIPQIPNTPEERGAANEAAEVESVFGGNCACPHFLLGAVRLTHREVEGVVVSVTRVLACVCHGCIMMV